MKRVLWVSRHEMTKDQRRDLERAMGEPVELEVWPYTVHSVEEILPKVQTADAVAVVLPTELLARLWKAAGDKPILQAVSGREATGRQIELWDGRTEQEFAYVHKGWQQILRMEVETKML